MQPKIMVEGHSFTFEKEGIRNNEAPFNLLPYKSMDSTRTKVTNNRMLRFMYDPDGKCIADLTGCQYVLPEQFKYVELPGVCETIHDRESAEKVAGALTPDVGWIFREGDCFKTREVPMINIFGNSFIVDTANFELVDALNRENKIGFDKINSWDDSGKLFFDYNIASLNVASETDDPDQVSIVILPPLKEIDPLGNEIIKSPTGIYRQEKFDLSPSFVRKPKSGKRLR